MEDTASLVARAAAQLKKEIDEGKYVGTEIVRHLKNIEDLTIVLQTNPTIVEIIEDMKKTFVAANVFATGCGFHELPFGGIIMNLNPERFYMTSIDILCHGRNEYEYTTENIHVKILDYHHPSCTKASNVKMFIDNKLMLTYSIYFNSFSFDLGQDGIDLACHGLHHELAGHLPTTFSPSSVTWGPYHNSPTIIKVMKNDDVWRIVHSDHNDVFERNPNRPLIEDIHDLP